MDFQTTSSGDDRLLSSTDLSNQNLDDFSLSLYWKIELGFDYLGFSVALCTRV